MAEKFCSICGERLKNGVCPSCMGSVEFDRNAYTRADYERSFDREYNYTEQEKQENGAEQFYDNPQNDGQFTQRYTEKINNGTIEYTEGFGRTSVESRGRIIEDFNGPYNRTTTTTYGTRPESSEIPEEVRARFEKFNKEAFNNIMNGGREKTPLITLIFSKEHRWKFILSIFLPFIGFFMGGLMIASHDPDTRKVAIAQALFSFVMFIISGMLLNSISG